MECLRVLGRRAVENGGGENGVLCVELLAGSLTLGPDCTGGVQFATRESKSGCIFLSNGASGTVGWTGAATGVVARVGPGEVNAAVPDKLFVLPLLNRAKRFAIY
jgi:hypothetical protein